MQGLMQDWPLLASTILDHANVNHGEREIVTRTIEGPIHRTTYSEVHSRARKVAKALESRGVTLGDRIGTLAWNTHRHLEAWYGIMGLGAIYHTINPRLFPEQLVYIINHAEDRMIFVDLTFVPILEGIQDQIGCVETYVIMTDADHMPDTSLKNAVAYEDLVNERQMMISPGKYSTKTRRPAFATPPAPRAIRKAFSIPTALTCCTAWRPRRAMHLMWEAWIRSCRWFPCSTPMPGQSPSSPQ